MRGFHLASSLCLDIAWNDDRDFRRDPLKHTSAKAMVTHRIPDNLELVILDCDGVMFDSFRSNVAFYNAVLAQIGEPPMDREAEQLSHVCSTPQLFQRMFKKNVEKYGSAMRAATEIDYLPFLEYMDPEPGLLEILGAVRARYRLAMATNRGQSAQPLLERFQLQGAFEAVSTIQDVAEAKPAPDLLLHSLRQTGVIPGRAVYVGDMESDLAAAEAAGIPFILKGGTFSHGLQIQALSELPSLLCHKRR